MTIRLTIGSNEKTLTSQEIENVANQVMKKLQKKMGAELRLSKNVLDKFDII